MNDAYPFRITATAGTKFVRINKRKSLSFFSFLEKIYYRILSIYLAGATIWFLSNIPHCCQKLFLCGPFFIATVIDHPLRSILDYWQGMILSYLLPNPKIGTSQNNYKLFKNHL